MELVLIIVYSLCLLVILAYSFVQLNLLIHYVKAQKLEKEEPATPSTWPTVTVQLPVFNELYVVERLLEAAVQLDYPADKLEIQVLDDSTDESRELTCQKV